MSQSTLTTSGHGTLVAAPAHHRCRTRAPSRTSTGSSRHDGKESADSQHVEVTLPHDHGNGGEQGPGTRRRRSCSSAWQTATGDSASAPARRTWTP